MFSPLLTVLLDVSRPAPTSSMPIGLVEAGLCAFILVALVGSGAAILWLLRTTTKRTHVPTRIGTPAPHVQPTVASPAAPPLVTPEPVVAAPVVVAPPPAPAAVVAATTRKASLIELAPSASNLPAAESVENRFPSVSPQPAWSVSWGGVADSEEMAVAFASASLPAILVPRDERASGVDPMDPVAAPSEENLVSASPRLTDDVDAATPTEILPVSREDLQLLDFLHLKNPRGPSA